jgi:hypothetical protein
MSYENHQGPTTVNYTVTSSLYDYIMRCLALGAIEGPIGAHDLAPALKTILNAAHHYLAGGEVEIKIVRRGNPDIVSELDGRFARVHKDANEINEAAGYYVAGTV